MNASLPIRPDAMPARLLAPGLPAAGLPFGPAATDQGILDTLLVTVAPVFDPGMLRRDVFVPHGLTIAEIVALAAPDEDPALMSVWLVTRSGMAEIHPWCWRRAKPQPHARIVIRPRPGEYLRTVLQILVTVVATAVAGPLAGLFLSPLAAGFGILKAGIALAITAVGGLLLNALFPQQTPEKEKPTFQLAGLRNPFSPGAPFPRLFGQMRVAPPFYAQSYIEIVDGEQYVRGCLVLGPGRHAYDEAAIKLGDTPLLKFDEVTLQCRYGLPGEDPITVYPRQVLPGAPLGVDLTRPYPEDDYGVVIPGSTPEATPEERWTAVDITGFSIILFMQEGMVAIDKKGRNRPVSVEFKVSIRAESEEDFTEIDTVTITASQRRPFFRELPYDVPLRGPRYAVKMERITPDSLDASVLTRVTWQALQSIRPEYPFAFPKPTAMIAFRAKASKQLNGQPDNLNVPATAMMRDFQPEGEALTGPDAWIEAETKNPAAHTIHALTGASTTRPQRDAAIDWSFFEDWHAFCVLKGLEYNRYHDFREPLKRTLFAIGAAGRARVFFDGVHWTGVIDRPRDLPVSQLNATNAWNFGARAEPVKKPDAFRAPFNDAANGWGSADRIVPWPAKIRYALKTDMLADLDPAHGIRAEVHSDPVFANNGYFTKSGLPGEGEWLDAPIVVVEQVDLPGVTSAYQAWKACRRQQYEIEHRSSVYDATQAGSARLASIGDMVIASKALLSQRISDARVVAVRGLLVEVDRPFSFEEGVDCAIEFIRSTEANVRGEHIIHPVSASAGEHVAFAIGGAGPAPEPGQIVHFGPMGASSHELILTSLERGTNGAIVQAFRPAAPIIDELSDADEPPAWNPRVGAPLPPSALAPPAPRFRRVLSGTDGTGSVDGLSAILAPGLGSFVVVASFEVLHRLDGAIDWNGPATAKAATAAVTIPGYVFGDAVELQARAISIDGVAGPYGPIVATTIGEDDFLPEHALDFSQAKNAFYQPLM